MQMILTSLADSRSLREATLALDKAARVMGLEINQDKTKYRIFPSITRTLCVPRTQYFTVLTNLLYRYRTPYVYCAPENTWNRTTGCGQARI
jgi:hypothetical protein